MLSIKRDLIKQQLELYPQMQIEDMLKALHQSEFGCAHFVSDKAEKILMDELSSIAPTYGEFVENLGDSFSRVHLRTVSQTGLTAHTLFKLFTLSGADNYGSVDGIEAKLDELLSMANNGELPFDRKQVIDAVNTWRNNKYPSCHHTESFREKYSPAYRVVMRKYSDFIPIFAAIDKLVNDKGRVIVAIDGGSASGKTTLSQVLSEVYDCNIFHMDDFFLRPEQRTSERFREIGGNVDYERFKDEVLVPLSRGEIINYRRYDCCTQKLQPTEVIMPKKINIIEGAYCLRKEMRGYYDLRILAEISPEFQKRRIEKRNTPQMCKRFFEEWIPLEARYFKEAKVSDCCHIIFEELDSGIIWKRCESEI